MEVVIRISSCSETTLGAGMWQGDWGGREKVEVTHVKKLVAQSFSWYLVPPPLRASLPGNPSTFHEQLENSRNKWKGQSPERGVLVP